MIHGLNIMSFEQQCIIFLGLQDFQKFKYPTAWSRKQIFNVKLKFVDVLQMFSLSTIQFIHMFRSLHHGLTTQYSIAWNSNPVKHRFNILYVEKVIVASQTNPAAGWVGSGINRRPYLQSAHHQLLAYFQRHVREHRVQTRWLVFPTKIDV